MSLTLPDRPEIEFNDLLLSEWDVTNTLGYDPNQTNTSADDHLPLVTSVDDTGAHYPSVVTTFSNETSPGASTYDFITTNGPGQTRSGSLVVTARAEDSADGQPDGIYTGDSGTYSAVSAQSIVRTLTDEVERIAQANATGGSTPFVTLGSFPAADTPDDTEETPTVRLASVTVSFSWTRDP